MNKFVNLLAAGTIACALIAAPASATVLLDLVDAPLQYNTAYSVLFNAGTNSTVISFSGYHATFREEATNIGLFLNGAGPNLLGTTWDFTPAPVGSLAGQAAGTLYLSGRVEGSYDNFFQTIGTNAGASYTLNFQYSNLTFNAPSGFRVSESEAVPEPATWAMMVLGFGVVGLAMRRRRQSAATVRRAT